MQSLTEAEIRAAFSEGMSRETVDETPLPDLDSTPWDALDYLGWIHPSGHIGYLVVISPDDGKIRGTVLRRGSFAVRKPGFEMCSLCHHVHQPDGTAMFTITWKDAGRHHTIGNLVCKDLDCSLRLRNIVPPATTLNESRYPEASIWRMQQALHKWLRTANRL